jgi:hypothetical protein
MGNFHPVKSAGVLAHHLLDHHMHPTQVDGCGESEIDPASRSDSGEREAEDDRKAEAAEPACQTKLPITLPP